MLKAQKYRELCAEIHRKYGKAIGLPYWESCDLASAIIQGEATRESVCEHLQKVAGEMVAQEILNQDNSNN